MQKIGAEGVQCGAIRDKGWGYALKCDDGNMAASQSMLAGLLLNYSDPEADQLAVLQSIANRPINSVRGAPVGWLRPAGPLA
jgi:L-asparaginase II